MGINDDRMGPDQRFPLRSSPSAWPTVAAVGQVNFKSVVIRKTLITNDEERNRQSTPTQETQVHAKARYPTLQKRKDSKLKKETKNAFDNLTNKSAKAFFYIKYV